MSVIDLEKPPTPIKINPHLARLAIELAAKRDKAAYQNLPDPVIEMPPLSQSDVKTPRS